MMNLLEPFKGVTASFFTGKDVSISKILPMVYELLTDCADEDDESARLPGAQRSSWTKKLPEKFRT